MEALNFEIESHFEEAKKCASDMNVEIIKMKNILNDLEDCVNSMLWSGTKAEEFKMIVKNAKEELDDIYTKHIINIPLKIEESVGQYKKYEQQ